MTATPNLRQELDELLQAAANEPDFEMIAEAIATLLDLVSNLVDPDPCRLDHHGGCQTHGWFSTPECPHATGQRLMASFKEAS